MRGMDTTLNRITNVQGARVWVLAVPGNVCQLNAAGSLNAGLCRTDIVVITVQLICKPVAVIVDTVADLRGWCSDGALAEARFPTGAGSYARAVLICDLAAGRERGSDGKA